MKKIYENFSCEIFPGFYESRIYNSDTLYYFEYDYTPDGYYWDFTGDGWKNFQQETCEKWVRCISDNFDENTIDLKIGKFSGIRSPREYNFTTDKISFNVDVDFRKLKSYCFSKSKNRKDFDDYLHNNWSDRPGFWSFVPSNVYDFTEELKNDSSLIDIMIEYYLLKNVNFEDVLMDCMDYEFERIHENVSLYDENNVAWEYEYNSEKEAIVPTKRIA